MVSPDLKPSILIVDEEPVYRAGLAAILTPSFRPFEHPAGEGFTMFPEPSDLAIIGRLPPTIASISFIQAIRRSSTPIVAVIGEQSNAFFRDAVVLGVDGFVHRADNVEIITSAVQSALERKPFVSAPLASRLFDMTRTPPSTNSVLHISGQQVRILNLLAQGYRNRAIAEELFLSEHTVKTYISDLLLRLKNELGPKGRNRAGLTRLAIIHGIVPNPAISQSP